MFGILWMLNVYVTLLLGMVALCTERCKPLPLLAPWSESTVPPYDPLLSPHCPFFFPSFSPKHAITITWMTLIHSSLLLLGTDSIGSRFKKVKWYYKERWHVIIIEHCTINTIVGWHRSPPFLWPLTRLPVMWVSFYVRRHFVFPFAFILIQ